MDLWTNTLAVLSKRDSECVMTEKNWDILPIRELNIINGFRERYSFGFRK